MALILPIESRTSPVLRIDTGAEAGPVETHYTFDDENTKVTVSILDDETYSAPSLLVFRDGKRIDYPIAPEGSYLPQVMSSAICRAVVEGVLPADTFLSAFSA